MRKYRQYRVPSGRRLAQSNPREFINWLLPYGMFELEDGLQVLFDRHYARVCERYPGQAPMLSDPAKSDNIKANYRTYIHDGLLHLPGRREAAIKVLKKWGMLEAVMQRAEAMEKNCQVLR
jgi:hypothetical protein